MCVREREREGGGREREREREEREVSREKKEGGVDALFCSIKLQHFTHSITKEDVDTSSLNAQSFIVCVHWSTYYQTIIIKQSL